MRKLSLTLLVMGLVLIGAAPRAHAQFFNLLTQFQNADGTLPAGGNVFSTDQLSALGVNGVAMNGVALPTLSTITVPLYSFATNSTVSNTGPGPGTFNAAYRIKVTVTPSNAAGSPLAGANAVTMYVTGTITGQVTEITNTLINTYNNLISTPNGQAEVFNFVYSAAGIPSQTFQLQALASGFNNGGSPAPKAGGATALIVSTPEPGALALFFGMGVSGALVVRRRLRRK